MLKSVVKDREKLIEFYIIFRTFQFWVGKCTEMAMTLVIPACFPQLLGIPPPKTSVP